MGCGRVNQAFTGALDAVLKDYLIFVAQLERQHKQGQLTLNKVRLTKSIINGNPSIFLSPWPIFLGSYAPLYTVFPDMGTFHSHSCNL